MITSGRPLIIGDARLNDITRDNPSIAKMGVVAWAGRPLRSTDGHVRGTFCVVDLVPRVWSPRQLEMLAVVSAAVESEIRLRTMLDAAAVSTSALQHELDVRERLAALAIALGGADTSATVAVAIIDLAPAVLECQFATVAVIDTDRRQLHLYTVGRARRAHLPSNSARRAGRW